MDNDKTLLAIIADFLFGRQYYTFLVRRIGTEEVFLTGEIFDNKTQAKKRQRLIEDTTTFVLLQMVSFRSRRRDVAALVADQQHEGLQ